MIYSIKTGQLAKEVHRVETVLSMESMYDLMYQWVALADLFGYSSAYTRQSWCDEKRSFWMDLDEDVRRSLMFDPYSINTFIIMVNSIRGTRDIWLASTCELDIAEFIGAAKASGTLPKHPIHRLQKYSEDGYPMSKYPRDILDALTKATFINYVEEKADATKSRLLGSKNK